MTADVEQSSGGLPLRRRALAVAAVLGAMALVVLDAGVANLALPAIAEALGVSPAATVLVVTSYQTALVMALLPMGALGERLGYRWVFSGGVAVFTLGSVLCALAPSLAWLVAARFVQGLGGAAVMALGVALLRFSTPQALFGAAIGWNAMTVALSGAAGPSVGALILSVADWHWIYAINLPLGALVLGLAGALPTVARSREPLDLLSMALSASTFALLVLGVEWISTRPVVGCALLAAASTCLTALIRREAPKAAPLVPLDLLRRSPFRISVIASVCNFTGQTAALVALPFYLQDGLGQSPMTAALYLTAWPLSVAVTAPFAGRMAIRVPTGILCATGGIFMAAGLVISALPPSSMGSWLLAPSLMICGVGFGLFQVSNNRNMFMSAPPERSGAAGALQGTARLTGQTSGAVLVTVLFAFLPAAGAPKAALAGAAALCLAAASISLWRGGRRESRSLLAL